MTSRAVTRHGAQNQPVLEASSAGSPPLTDVDAALAELLADVIVADFRRFPSVTVASPRGPNQETVSDEGR